MINYFSRYFIIIISFYSLKNLLNENAKARGQSVDILPHKNFKCKMAENASKCNGYLDIVDT